MSGKRLKGAASQLLI